MLARRVCLNGVGALGLMVLLTAPVRAETAEPPAADGRWGKTVELQDVGSGELLWRSPQGLIPLPVLDIDVELTVTGVLLRGTVTQVFHNPTPETIEAIYVFPLPEGASVHRMEMRIGDRRIHSVMQERQQATRTYEHAKATGRKAALLNQHRPNLFSVAVANLNPDETLAVVLDYSDEATYVDGSFELAFPLAYTPRYIPRSFVAGTGEERAALAGRAPNPGATFPTAKVGVRLRPGLPLERVESDSHSIEWLDDGDGIVVRTRSERVAARRDFLLRWTPRLDALPRPVVLVEDREEERYALLMLFPPLPGSEAGLGLPTETLFVIDVSGSMRGPSIRQARAALLAALRRLRPDDRFNMLKFNDHSEAFRPQFQFAENEPLAAARDWIDDLEAGGGTEIHTALMRGLAMMGASRSSSAQRVIFLTDGAVANEDQLYQAISERLGQARLHTIGIEPAPNRYLMRKMARFGRGLCRFVADASQAENRIDAFFARLERPVMTDLALAWDGLVLEETYPSRLPDLHAGEPLVLYGRLNDSSAHGTATLSGETRAGWIETSAKITAEASRGSGIAARWARAKVDTLIDSLHEGAAAADVRAEVVDLALDFDLVTAYTSLVAVEEVATALDSPRTMRQAGTLPQGGTSRPLRLFLGLLLAGSGLALFAIGKPK